MKKTETKHIEWNSFQNELAYITEEAEFPM